MAQIARRSRRRWFLLIGAALLLILFALAGLSGFYVDILWFREVHQSGVFWTTFWSKVLLGFVFGVIFFVLLMVNLLIVRRLAPRFRVFSPETEVIERYRAAFEPYAKYLVPAFAAIVAIFVGVAASAQWKTFLLWRSASGVSFGTTDPVFGRDPAYYIFVLPFQKFIQGWFFSALLGVTVITAIAHYLTGGIRAQAAGERVTPQVKAHLSVLIGLIVLAKAYGYYLGRYDLLVSERGVGTGASYTDIHVVKPALLFLAFIAIACAVLFLVNIRFRGWALPVIGIGLLAVSSIVVGGIVPATVQKFSVAPQEFQREQPYIKRNMEATRFAYGLDKINLSSTTPTVTVPSSAATADKATLDNIRLWNPNVLKQNYQSLQRLQQYYEFTDVDVDRYPLEGPGSETQVMLSAREVAQAGIPGSRTWQNQHLVYTHGYGAAASQVNSVTTTGGPDFVLQDIPPTGVPALRTTPRGSQLYYAETTQGVAPYLVVDTKQRELNYPQGTTQVYTTYQGKGGIPIGSFFRRLVFAYHFRDINLLISGLIDSNSRILIYRDLGTRIQRIAPFLKYDADPYVALVGGHAYYIWDAYTTTDLYPYSQRVDLSTATGQHLSGRANYIRNSVKVVMNAYDGTVRFYVVDPSDPLIKAWENAFPRLFTPVEQAPSELQQHFRYPEDMLMTQAYEYRTYHVPPQDAQTFYSGDRAWDLPPALPSAPPAAAGTNVLSGGTSSGPFRPYYVISRIPGSETERFVLFEPFAPPSRNNMVSYLAAGSDAFSPSGSSSDPGDYGNLTAVQFPASENILGPVQARNLVNQDPDTSQRISLLSQRGSTVQFGDLLVVPVEDSFLYVQPIYIASEQQGAIPQLKLVDVVNGSQVSLGTNLVQALSAALGQQQPGQTCPDGSPPPCAPTGQTAADLLAQAQHEFDLAQTALQAGDLAGYQQHINAAKALVAQAAQLLAAQTGGSGPGSTPTPSPSPSGSP